MTLVSVWADGFAVKLHVAEKPDDMREVAWLFELLRRAYGR